MTKRRMTAAFLIVAAMASTACECLDTLGNRTECPVEKLVEALTWLAYGQPVPDTGPENTCPGRLVCLRPSCMRVEENGSFEDRRGHSPWYGDRVLTSPFSCDGSWSLGFDATTPDGPSASRSSQIFQVFDFRGLVPPDQRATMRRVRAEANYHMFLPRPDEPRQFGLRIDAYEGDPTSFPREGDPEDIPAETATYRRLETTESSFLYDLDGPAWQSIGTLLELPAGTDFFVVLLEAFENDRNEVSEPEFGSHYVDFVQVAIDGGNTPPVAWSFRTFTLRDTPVDVPISAYDADSRIDPSSVVVVRPPSEGIATSLANGRIRYAPNPGFVGRDSLAYTVADEEGLVSNEAQITIDVRFVNDPPVAQDDAYVVPEGGILIVPAGLGVLANDFDPNGDELTAVLVSDVQYGSLSLDASGAFVYTTGEGFTESDAFVYRAFDGMLESNDATVTLTAAGVNRAPIARDDTVVTSGGLPVVIDVLANDEDPDGDPLTIASVSQPANGTTMVLLDRVISYAPDDGFSGTDVFTYVARDDKGAESNEALVTVVVEPRYDLAIITQASNDVFTPGQETLVFFNVLVGNLGGGYEAQGVEASNHLPEGFGYLSHEVSVGDFDPDTGIWEIGSLITGPYATLRIYARAADEPGEYTFAAELTGGLEFDFNGANNADSVTVTVEDAEPPG